MFASRVQKEDKSDNNFHCQEVYGLRRQTRTDPHNVQATTMALSPSASLLETKKSGPRTLSSPGS
jgi:hypothetical protein